MSRALQRKFASSSPAKIKLCNTPTTHNTCAVKNTSPWKNTALSHLHADSVMHYGNPISMPLPVYPTANPSLLYQPGHGNILSNPMVTVLPPIWNLIQSLPINTLIISDYKCGSQTPTDSSSRRPSSGVEEFVFLKKEKQRMQSAAGQARAHIPLPANSLQSSSRHEKEVSACGRTLAKWIQWERAADT